MAAAAGLAFFAGLTPGILASQFPGMLPSHAALYRRALNNATVWTNFWACPSVDWPLLRFAPPVLHFLNDWVHWGDHFTTLATLNACLLLAVLISPMMPITRLILDTNSRKSSASGQHDSPSIMQVIFCALCFKYRRGYSNYSQAGGVDNQVDAMVDKFSSSNSEKPACLLADKLKGGLSLGALCKLATCV